MIKGMKNLFLFSFFCSLTVILTGCEAGTSPNANMTANAVSSPVRTIQANRTEVNTMATPEPVEIDEKTIKTALKEELKNTKANIMTPEQWEKDGWMNFAFSRFYGDRPRLVSDAVVKVTNEILKGRGKRMIEASERELRGLVKPDTLCKDAVEPMWKASAKNESILP